jgi:hypothetical protein
MYDKIRQWAHDRNLIEGSTPARQFKKLMEEFGELGCAVAENNEADIKDAIGDIAVVLTIMAAQIGYTDFAFGNDDSIIDSRISELASNLSVLADMPCAEYIDDAFFYLIGYCTEKGYSYAECLELAYNQIKERKGRMIDGIFVKE